MVQTSRRKLLLSSGAASLLGAATWPVWAQNFPSKSIRLVVPQAAGGGSDTIARYVAEKLSLALGQQVVVDNKPGAAGMLGAEIVKSAAPDGYTMLLGAIDTITAPIVSKRRPFDGVSDFSAITQLTASHNVLVVGPSFTGKTLADLVAQAKGNPGRIDYASSGIGSMQHLAGEMLARMTSIQITHVPYKGGPPAFTDLVGGRIPAMVSGMQGALPQIKAEKIRALAVTGMRRSPALPDVPTFIEGGVSDFVVNSWVGLLAPAKTPAAVMAGTSKLLKPTAMLATIFNCGLACSMALSMRSLPVVSAPTLPCKRWLNSAALKTSSV